MFQFDQDTQTRESEMCLLTCTSDSPLKQKQVLISKGANLAIADAVGKVAVLRILYPLVHKRKSQDLAEIEQSIVTNLKAIKNDVEIEGFRKCHIRDGAALVRYFAWLEEQLRDGLAVSESQGADQLEKYRS